MRSGLRFWVSLAIFAATGLSSAVADIVHFSKEELLVGRVSSFDREAVLFAEGCDGHETRLSWQKISRLEFGPNCEGAPDASLMPMEERCDGEKFRVFMIEFKRGGAPVIAETAAVTRDRILHLYMLDPWDQAHGSVDEVRQIARINICREEIKRSVELPLAYCSEPRQIAVNFDYGTPLNNRILTNGFSFYIRVSGEKPASFDLDGFRKEVRSGFQHAVSLWTSALQERKHMLTEEISRFIESRVSRNSSGYVLLTPPQVIELSCPQSATFVVDLSFGNRELFPRPPLVIAKAQTEGRTIALNVHDIKCFRSEFKFDENDRLPFELSDRCLNLVPIMTHELGHAFGIGHIDDAGQHSIMDSRFSRDALVPTDRDVVELVRVLSKSISGSSPGTIEMVSSSGVQPPQDYVECPDGSAGSGSSGCD